MLKPSLPTLVDIYIKYAITKDGDERTLASLCHELEKMAGQNVVETINLTVWVPSDYDLTEWDELDDVFMGSPEGWPALREFSLLFGILSTSEDDDPHKEVREFPTMTKLVESQRVQYDVDILWSGGP